MYDAAEWHKQGSEAKKLSQRLTKVSILKTMKRTALKKFTAVRKRTTQARSVVSKKDTSHNSNYFHDCFPVHRALIIRHLCTHGYETALFRYAARIPYCRERPHRTHNWGPEGLLFIYSSSDRPSSLSTDILLAQEHRKPQISLRREFAGKRRDVDESYINCKKLELADILILKTSRQEEQKERCVTKKIREQTTRFKRSGDAEAYQPSPSPPAHLSNQKDVRKLAISYAGRTQSHNRKPREAASFLRSDNWNNKPTGSY